MRIRKLENKTVSGRAGLHTPHFSVQYGVTEQSLRYRRNSCAGVTFDSLFQKNPAGVRITATTAGHMSVEKRP